MTTANCGLEPDVGIHTANVLRYGDIPFGKDGAHRGQFYVPVNDSCGNIRAIIINAVTLHRCRRRKNV